MPTLYRLTIENTTQDLIKPGSAVLRRIPPVPFEAGLQIGLPITLCTLYFPCRPKHPVKVHVWAGISMRGRTGICILDGMMDGESYVSILRQTLLPFLCEVYPDGHRFMQDNDPNFKL